MRVVAYYTENTPYEEEVPAFSESLEKFGVDYKIYPIPSNGSWVKNCGQKASVIRRAIDDTEDNILYLDIDARAVRQPPFEEIEKQIPGFCVWHGHRRGPELLSGTIYFPNNDLSRLVLDAWMVAQQASPNVWDQKVLQTIYQRFDHFNLGNHWVKIFDNSKMDNGIEPIFVHYQASRRNKRRV